MLGLLFGRRATEEERASLRRKCATRETAVAQCLAANDAASCDAFGQDLDLCKVRAGASVAYVSIASAFTAPVSPASARSREPPFPDRSSPRSARADFSLFPAASRVLIANPPPRPPPRVQGRVVCPDAAAAFSRCTHLVVNHTGKKADLPDCGPALKKLRACLRSKRA